MSEFIEFLKSIWDMFEQVQCPGINISFAQLWIGVFVVTLSITILRPLLGIGVSGINNLSKGIGGWYKRRVDTNYKVRKKSHDKKSN